MNNLSRNIKSLLILSSLIFIRSIFAADIALTDASKPITVTKSNPIIVINLASNPTTGYSWVLLKYDNNLLTPVARKYNQPQTMLIGASGYETWTFKVKPTGFVVPQITDIELAYVRPWEHQQINPTTFKVAIYDH